MMKVVVKVLKVVMKVVDKGNGGVTLYSISCVIRNIIAKIQSRTAIFLFPGSQESGINSPYVPRMSHITRLLNVKFRLLLHLAAVS